MEAAAPAAAAATPAADAPALAELEGPSLLAALRAEGNRALTREVRALKGAEWKRARSGGGRGGMARHLVEDVHAHFRELFADVLESSRRAGAVNRTAFSSANSHLHMHHGIEDAAWFPALCSEAPELTPQVHKLSQDHRALVALEERVEGGSLEALAEFVEARAPLSLAHACDAPPGAHQPYPGTRRAQRLNEHLDLEELLTVPLLMQGRGGL